MIERQLTFLVSVVNSLFSYGLPSASVKLSDVKSMGEMNETQKPIFVDLQIVQRVVYLCDITNQVLGRLQRMNTDLEYALLGFVLGFKNHILTDQRMILLASCLAQEANGGDSPPPVDTIDGVYNESQQAYNTIALLTGYQSM